ncbi:MAG: 16S rRNA (cytidine(1402)-2'-O)-methyltransferase, partial [Myxococcales bacterium]|nr:16S rRNA (cytidine(1402)-2'-O)-methyltransferase [Myxococcales bacterium]
ADRDGPRGMSDEEQIAATEKLGTLYVVATPIGNLDDMTLRAIKVLKEVPVIAAEDTRSAQNLLRHFEIARPTIVSFFEGNEAGRTEHLMARLRGGDDVAVISEAGTPGVSDPGARLVAAAVAAGVRVVPIPGASAALAALVASGLPSDEFYFVGFPARDGGPRLQSFARLRNIEATLIIYEAPGRAAATLHDLAAVFGDTRRACVARELTKIHEELARGTLKDLLARFAESAPRGEVTIVVEGAAATTADTAVDVEAEVKRRLADGESPKEIAAALALLSGKPKRQIYQLAIALKRD